MDYSVNKPIWPGSSSFTAGSTPFGYFDNDAQFQNDVDSFAKFAAQTLGYPIMDVELVDLFKGERQWDYEDDFRRNYDYVLELISDKPFPLVIHINNTAKLERYKIRILGDSNQPYIWVANIQTMLKKDIKMLGFNLDSVSFGSTAIQIKNVDRSADFNKPQD